MNRRGFTIVELLIVIIVIGILATLVLVSYNGIQVKARNTQRLDEAKQAFDLINTYYGTNGAYPTIGSGADAVCVGSSFADLNGDGKPDCWDANGNGSDTPGNVTRHTDSTFAAALTSTGTVNDTADPPIYYPPQNIDFVGPVFFTPAHVDSGGYYGIRYWQEKTTTCPLGSLMYSHDGIAVECTLNFPAH